MLPQTFIFIGRSGCGKGTQAEFLTEYLREKDAERNIFYLQTGAVFREFIKGENYTNRLSREIYDAGGLQPEFLAIYIWSSVMIEKMREGEHMIIDGTPRKFHEAGALESALNFYNREKVFIIFLNVSRKWSEERLLGRQRMDDDIENVKKRLDWYDTDVAPTVEFFKNNPNYNFLDVNGEQTRPEVRNEMIKKIEEIWTSTQ